ncbi:Primosomal protein I [Leclercia adecarboxylata]|uniref:Primosomal protein I n=1 Tax=Leclercia adecarboxylata TaxID=83655 RepID=A0A4U9HIP0_9ENTR|nr:Primosomal protein I [Leclercia adecarboxylata]
MGALPSPSLSPRKSWPPSLLYWQAEGKVFHHIQWQQKLARSVQINRPSNGAQSKRDVNAFSEPDKQIPHGFRGAK